MVITEIEAVSRARYKIFIDGKFTFLLYKGELSRYHLAKGSDIEVETFRQIRREVVLKRAKLRALHLLNDMGRTEEQLRQKLKQNHYPEDIVRETLDYVRSFGYINDGAYARNFIETRKGKKSRREIYAKLCEKGIEKEEIDQALEECYSEGRLQRSDSGNLQRKRAGYRGKWIIEGPAENARILDQERLFL